MTLNPAFFYLFDIFVFDAVNREFKNPGNVFSGMRQVLKTQCLAVQHTNARLGLLPVFNFQTQIVHRNDIARTLDYTSGVRCN